MTQSVAALDSTDSNTYSVRTLGLRAADADSAEVAAQVKQRFKVDEARALMVLKGQVVARNLPIERARALKTVLFEIGLLAKVQETGSAAEREVSDNESPAVDVDVFLSGLDRSSSGVEPDRKYRTLAVFMLVGAVVAPALYLAAIVGIAAGMWTYVEHVTIGESLGGALLYLAPLLIGLTVEIFMVRPLFLGVELPTRMPIAESDAPDLYQLVRRMSIATNTPEPENIYLDALPNASVSSCAGAKGILQKRLELTVGMPLAYGMSAAELASVIAHEFGHFSQTFEMFSSSLVNRVNGWMARCAWCRDPLEIKLEAWQRTVGSWVAWPTYSMVWSVRGVRWVMQRMLGLSMRLTRALSQQMEFNADDHAVQIVGSGVFVTSSYRLRELMHAYEAAMEMNYGAYDENRLLRNLPDAVRAICDGFDQQSIDTIRQELEAETTEYWSTHPADRERIDRARSQHVSDVQNGDFPATALFKDPVKLAHRLTMQTYTRDHDMQDASKCVVDNNLIFEIRRDQGDAEHAIDEFFGGAFDGRILHFVEPRDISQELPTDPLSTLRRWQDLSGRAENLFLSSVYADAGIVLPAGTWAIADHDPSALDAELSVCMSSFRKSRRELEAIDHHYHGLICERVASHKDPHRAEALLGWLVDLARVSDDVDSLDRYSGVLRSMLDVQSDHGLAELDRKVVTYRDYCVDSLNKLLVRLDKMSNPLASVAEPETVTCFLATWNVEPMDADATPSHAQDVAASCRNGIYFLNRRVVGELAVGCLETNASDHESR